MTIRVVYRRKYNFVTVYQMSSTHSSYSVSTSPSLFLHQGARKRTHSSSSESHASSSSHLCLLLEGEGRCPPCSGQATGMIFSMMSMGGGGVHNRSNNSNTAMMSRVFI